MKKTYLAPEVEVQFIVCKNHLLLVSTNGENLTQRTYGYEAGEDVEDFWN